MSNNEIKPGSDIATDGPFKLEMTLYFEAIAGENVGYQAKAKLDLKPGIVPTDDDIKTLIAQAQIQLGDSYRLLTRHEFVADIFSERMGVGIKVAVPGANAFRLVDGESK